MTDRIVFYIFLKNFEFILYKSDKNERKLQRLYYKEQNYHTLVILGVALRIPLTTKGLSPTAVPVNWSVR